MWVPPHTTSEVDVGKGITMEEHSKTTNCSYVRGNKGSLGTRIFFKGVIYLLIFQMVLFGVPFPVAQVIQSLPEPIQTAYDDLPESVREAIESLEIKEAHAVGEVEFVSIIDPDNGAGTDYTSLTSWESSNQVDLTAATTLVFSHGGITGTIADGSWVKGASFLFTFSLATSTFNSCSSNRF